MRCQESISLSDLQALSQLVEEINDEIVAIAHGKLDPQSEETIAGAFASIDNNCVLLRNNSIQYGGIDPRVVKACLKFAVALSIAVSIYGIRRLTELDRTNCYAWYSPFATLVRTPIQNTYCTVLRNADKAIDDVVRKGIRVDDMNQIFKLGSVFTTGAVTLKALSKSIMKFNSSLNTIVDYVYHIRDANLKQDAVNAVQDIVEKLAEKAVNNNNAQINNNASQAGGKRKSSTRARRSAT